MEKSLFSFGEGEIAFFSVKRWDRRNRAGLVESATPCHQVVGSYRVSNPLHLIVLAVKSQDYTTAPEHLLQMLYLLPYSTWGLFFHFLCEECHYEVGLRYCLCASNNVVRLI